MTGENVGCAGRADRVHTARMSRIRSVPSQPWQLAACACSVVAAFGLAFIPLGGSQTSYADSAGNVSIGPVTHLSLLQSQGPSVLFILAVPVVLTLIGVLSPARLRLVASVVSTSLLGLFAFVGMLSVGLFFIPAVLCSTVAIARSLRSWPAPTPSGETVTV